MGRTIDEVMATLPKERQDRVNAEADSLIKEYRSLAEFRKAVGITQVKLAGKLNITQENVSRLERRKDMHLSTLRKYVEALGGELEVSIKWPVSMSESGTLAGHLDL